MNKVWLIIRREYVTRVRKKSFLLMTILGPLLFGAFIFLSSWLQTVEDKEVRIVAVVDSSRLFLNKIPNTKNYKFEYIFNTKVKTIKEHLDELNYSAILYIPHIVTYDPNTIVLYSDGQPSVTLLMHITNSIERYCEQEKLKSYNINDLDNILQSVNTKIHIRTVKLEGGKEKRTSWQLNTIVATTAGFLIYIFIFMFSSQVMRGVAEEKTNRIVEVVVSSVKPFQLMTGKITGIALVGLTQFVIWIFLTSAFYMIGRNITTPDVQQAITSAAPQNLMEVGTTVTEQSTSVPEPLVNDRSEQLQTIIDDIGYINWYVMLSMFFLFFIGGYLLYGSLFAAIGAIVDTDTDIQQFVLPVTIPLMLSVVVMFSTIKNPDGNLSYWLSLIPFTSPIVMMARMPFGVPIFDVAFSLLLLAITITVSMWLAARIYRTGILMYGKKVTYKELWKWMRFRS